LPWLSPLFALVVFVACGPWNGQNIRTESDKRHVLFTFAGKAESVCLSGDFNGWSPGSLCLEMEDGRWKVEVFLAPGRYRYGFLLDGKDWVPDPSALLLEEDGFGKLNSVLVVE
jgi:1,4-alpha-glucan branching enzyme